jgi:hypothetical protein
MAENLQQSAEQQRGPFSPLQTGCAVVMLVNMLIYLGVVLFTFNLLDPSKIDASYLATRGFSASPTPKSEQDLAFQRVSQKKHEEQRKIQSEMLDTSNRGIPKEPSPAVQLSQLDKPRAARTEGSYHTGRSATRTASTRFRSLSIYSQPTLPKTYSTIRIPDAKILVLETYQILPVEIASGIGYPTFSLPTFDAIGSYLYHPPNPIPEASSGGPRLNTPPVGAESTQTNQTKKAKEPPTASTTEKPPAKDPL